MKTATQTTQEIHFEDVASKGEVAVQGQTEDNASSQDVTSTPTPVIQREDVAKLAGAIAKVMAEIGVVTKTGEHKHFHFRYATANDLLTKLTPLMGKNGIAVIQDEVSRNFVETNYVAANYEFTIMHESGAVWPHRPRFTGLSLAKSEKGGFDPACLNKCAIAARKYFLLSLFQIPASDVDDADRGENDVSGPQKQASRRAPNPSQQATPSQHRVPVKIPAEGSRANWAKEFDAAISSSKNIKELSSWKAMNETTLEDIKVNAPKLFSGVDAHYRDIAAKFAPAKTDAAPAESAFDIDAPNTWAEYPLQLIKMVDAKLTEFSNIHDPGGLGDWFFETVESHLVDAELQPADVNALKKLYDKHFALAGT